MQACLRQPIAVSDISIYICLIDIRSKSRTTEWEASRLVKGFPNYRISTNSSSRWQKIVFFFSSVVKSQLESTPKNSQEQSIWVQNIGLTFAPAASMFLTHSSRFSIIAEQLDVIKEVMTIISMVKVTISYCDNSCWYLPVVRIEDESSVVFVIRSLQQKWLDL